jgi:hypothetical protein
MFAELGTLCLWLSVLAEHWDSSENKGQERRTENVGEVTTFRGHDTDLCVGVEHGFHRSAAVFKINIHISPMAYIRENLQEFLAYLVTNEILCPPILLIYVLLWYLCGQIVGVEGLDFDLRFYS